MIRNYFKHSLVLSSVLILTSCGGGGGGAAVVQALAAQISSFAASVSTSLVGGSVDITWTSTNSTSCVASGSWTGTKSSSGSETVTISNTGSNSFTLTCNGEGGNATKALSVDGYRNITGISVDGYISGATIFIDQNDNAENDTDEDSTTSDTSGAFTIKHSNGNLFSLGGQDVDTQVQLDGLLLASPVSGYSSSNFLITPITTIAALLPNENIYNLLGIDSSIDIFTQDPVALKGDGGINDYVYEKGNQLTILALSLFNVSKNLNGADSGDSTAGSFTAISEEIKKSYDATSLKVDIENDAFISNVIDNLMTQDNVTISDTNKTNTLNALSSVMPLIAVKSSDDITTALMRFGISTMQTDLVSIANGSADEALISNYTINILSYIASDQSVDKDALVSGILASNDVISLDEDTAVEINVLSNDSLDSTGTPVITVSAPTNGTAIVGSGGVITYTPTADFNGTDSFSYTVTQGTKSGSATVSITINPVNDSPVINAASTIAVNENTTSVGTIGTSDVEGDTLVLTLDGTDASSFDLSSSNALSFITAPDFETKTSYSLTFSVTDGSLTSSKDITINIINLNDVAPEFTSSSSYSAAENQTSVGTAKATDVEGDTLTYSISGTELAITSTGLITFKSAPDFESKTSYTASVTVSDGVNETIQDITVSVTNLNDVAPIISSSTSLAADENQTTIGTLTVVDPEGGNFTFTAGGTDGSLISISSSGVLSFKTAPNYENKASYVFTVTVSDGVNTSTKTFTISINDIAEIPTTGYRVPTSIDVIETKE